MNNKKLYLIGGAAVIVVVLLGSVIMFLNSRSVSQSGGGKVNQEEIENLIELSAEDVGLSLSSQKNNQQLVMELTKLSDIESFEYELSYDAIEGGESVSRGTFGSGPNPDEKGKSVIKRVMDLGTCSSGVCKYDKGVKKVLFQLRVNLKSGEAGIIEETFLFE